MKRVAWVSLVMIGVLVAGAAWADDEADWKDKFSFSGYLDTRIQFYTWTPDVNKSVAEDMNTSDIKVFESAVSPTVALTDYLSATAVFYYIDTSNGDHTGRTESLTVDEFYMILSYPFDDGKSGTIWAKMGKYYPPVGRFKTWGVGYTRVQDLFWTRVSGLGVGYDHDYFGVSGHVFNGDFDNVDETSGAADPSDDAIDNFAAALRISPLAGVDDQSLDVGGYFLSDATETLFPIEGLLAAQDIAGTPADASDDVVLYKDNVPLYGAYLVGDFTVNDMFGIGVAAEYATTGEFDKDAYVNAAGDATGISVTNGEISFMFDKRRVQVGGRYAQIDGMDWLGTTGLDPAFEPTTYTQFGGYVGTDYIDQLHLAIQYLAGSDNESNTDSLAEFQAKVVF